MEANSRKAGCIESVWMMFFEPVTLEHVGYDTHECGDS
jgi:hypothetical protein